MTIEFESGQTASFMMMAFTEFWQSRSVRRGRGVDVPADPTPTAVALTAGAAPGHLGVAPRAQTRIFGTHGELITDGITLTLHDFRTRKAEDIQFKLVDEGGALVGHDGGDFGLIDAFITAVATGNPAPLLSGARESLASHLMVFAAEHARRTGTVVDFAAFCAAHNVPADLAHSQ